MAEFVVREDGLLTEKSIFELATWYSAGGQDQESFEAHLMMLRAYAALVSSAQRGRRTAMTIERFSLLRLLYRAPQRRLLMSDISRALHVSATSVSKLVNGLVHMHFVQRVGYTGDKRRTWAQITSDGVQVVEEYIPGFREATKARWRGLTKEEKRMLVHLLSKLLVSVQSGRAETRMRALEVEAASAPEASSRSEAV